MLRQFSIALTFLALMQMMQTALAEKQELPNWKTVEFARDCVASTSSFIRFANGQLDNLESQGVDTQSFVSLRDQLLPVREFWFAEVKEKSADDAMADAMLLEADATAIRRLGEVKVGAKLDDAMRPFADAALLCSAFKVLAEKHKTGDEGSID